MNISGPPALDDSLISTEYILQLDDDMLCAFVDDARIRACEKKSGCTIELTKRILNKQYVHGRLTKFCIVKITGRDQSAISRCVKLIERIFPDFINRKEYTRRAPFTIYTKEFCPENAHLYLNCRKTGAAQNCFGDVPLKSPFATSINRPIGKTPWKVTADERLGNVDPSHLLNILQFYKPNLINYERQLGEDSDEEEEEDDEDTEDEEEATFFFGGDKQERNEEFGKVSAQKATSFMGQRLLDNIPSSLKDPLVIMFDGKDIFMVGSSAVKMTKGNDNRLSLDVCSADYKIHILDEPKPPTNTHKPPTEIRPKIELNVSGTLNRKLQMDTLTHVSSKPEINIERQDLFQKASNETEKNRNILI